MEGFHCGLFVLASEAFSQFLCLCNELIFGQVAIFMEYSFNSGVGWHLNFYTGCALHLFPKSFGYGALAYGSAFIFYIDGLIFFDGEVIKGYEIFEHFIARLGVHAYSTECAAFVVGSFFKVDDGMTFFF